MRHQVETHRQRPREEMLTSGFHCSSQAVRHEITPRFFAISPSPMICVFETEYGNVIKGAYYM